jgi:prevent-host-death family protein
MEVSMDVTTWDSRHARENWRDLLDMAAGKADVVITRHGKPAAVLIDYADYLALQEELEELRSARRAQTALERWRQDPSLGRPYAEIRQELIADGLLDEEV